MQKTKRSRSAIVAVLIFSMMAMYGLSPVARAASLTAASDTISDSDVSAAGVTHTVAFTTGQDLTAGYKIDIDFTDVIGVASGNATCPLNSTASDDAGTVLTCTVDVAQTLTAGSFEVVLTGTTNPGSSGGRTVQILTETDLDVEVENGSVRFYILDDVTVTAHVDASLTFTVAGLADDQTVNSEDCDVTTTATETDFETLAPGVPVTVCQQLSVITNASAGYSVTVQQDGDLTSAGGDSINEFADGAGLGQGAGNAATWAVPSATLGSVDTYGHFGLTSADASLSWDGFAASEYVGFSATAPVEVMYHDGPADGTTVGAGLTQVAYTAEVSALQEAGDYESTLTYIATATY